MKTGHIYAIKYEPTGRICYVGQTRNKPQARWRQHKRALSQPIGEFMQLMGVEAFTFEVLETTTLATLNEREKYWIAAYGTLHPGGFNMIEGGTSSGRSARTKAKMAAANAARTRKPEARKARAQSALAQWANPDTRETILTALRASRKTEDFRNKASAASKAKWDDPVLRARMQEAMTKSRSDPAYRARMSEAVRAGKAKKRAEKENAYSSGS
ncbi:MAG: GIY-YIG nuclease family protein [Aquidulcibacter sp.]